MCRIVLSGAAVLLGLAASAGPAAANWPCVLPPPIRFEERVITKFRPEYRTEFREVRRTVFRKVPETRVEEVREQVPVTTFREEQRQRTVMVPVTTERVERRTVLRTEWRGGGAGARARGAPP